MQLIAILLPVAILFLPSVLADIEIRANGTFSDRQYYSTINVVNGGPWGSWTWSDKCPEGSYAIGYSIKVEQYTAAGDDTALNGIRLLCTSTNNVVYTVESGTESFGDWSRVVWCPTGVLKSFQLQVEAPQGAIDDTAANNIRFRCSSGAIIETTGGDFGEYGGWSNECTKGGICGIETKMEVYGGFFVDDTSLNDVRFFCCE